MSIIRSRKLSVSSISTEGSSECISFRSSRCVLKQIFMHQNVLTEVLLYDDSIAFSNNDGLNIFSFSGEMKFSIMRDQEKTTGFIIFLGEEQYKFDSEDWVDCQEWAILLSNKLIQFGGFHEKYLLKKTIGKGASCKVYLAQDIDSRNQVAVKVLQKSKTANQLLMNEINILRRISHQNIIQLHSVYENQKCYFIVLEYFNGSPLDKLLFEQKFELFERKQLMKKMLEVVDYLHRENILHRDIKPQNILVNERTLDIKLIDFGLAVDFNHVDNYSWCGTLGYVAPQSLLDTVNFNSFQMIAKIDMYSIGAVLYELIFNQRLHNGINKDEIMKLNLKSKLDVQSIKCIVETNELILLKGLLEKNPKKRFGVKETMGSIYFSDPNPEILCDSNFTKETVKQSPSVWNKLVQLFSNHQQRKV